METNLILNPPEKKNWDENDNFATQTIEKGEGIVKEVIDGAKETAKMVVDEAKTIAPDVIEVVDESSERLNAKPRVIGAVPNNLLFYGIIALGVYVIIKKVL